MFLCAYLYFSGRALIQTLLRPVKGDLNYLLSPVASLAAHAVVIGTAVFYGFTTSGIARFGWPAGLILMLFGMRNAANENKLRQWLPDALALTLIGMVPLAGAFYYGLLDFPGSPALDGWSYIAFAQYLYDYRIGFEGGLAPLYQYAAHLAGTRFIAPALIGYLAFPLIESNLAQDVQQAANLFLGIVAFSYASACLYVWRSHNQEGRGAFIYGLFCISSYWIIRILSANNFDNFLFLAILPAVTAARFVGRPASAGLPLLIGLFVAAEIYSYPEMAPIAAFLAFACVVAALINRPEEKREILRASIVAVLATAILCAPMAEHLWKFFVNQATFAMSSGARPGEGAFPELFMARESVINFFGFEIPAIESRTNLLLLVSIGVAMIFVRGILLAIRKKDGHHLLAFFLLMVAGYVYMLWRKRYDYGAYKFAVSGWWVTAYYLLAGIQSIPKGGIHGKAVLVRRAMIALLLSIFGGTTVAYYWHPGYPDYRSLGEFREMRAHLGMFSSRPIYNALEDPRANMWATYFLRSQSLIMLNLTSYMAQKHLEGFMERAAPKKRPPGAGEIILVDSKYQSCADGQPIWSNSKIAAFVLKADRPALLGISSPNGLESQGGKIFTWIENRPVVMRVAMASAARVVLVADLGPGPSTRSGQIPKMRISDGGNIQTLEVGKKQRYEISVSLKQGLNEIRIWSDDTPDTTSHAMRDPRTMLIGMRCVLLRSGDEISRQSRSGGIEGK